MCVCVCVCVCDWEPVDLAVVCLWQSLKTGHGDPHGYITVVAVGHAGFTFMSLYHTCKFLGKK